MTENSRQSENGRIKGDTSVFNEGINKKKLSWKLLSVQKLFLVLCRRAVINLFALCNK